MQDKWTKEEKDSKVEGVDWKLDWQKDKGVGGEREYEENRGRAW